MDTNKLSRLDTVGMIRASILAILNDAPFVDYESLVFLQGRSTLYTTISKMKDRGWVESVASAKANVFNADKLIRITPKGRLVLDEILYCGRYRGLDTGNERPLFREFIPLRLPVTRQATSGVKSHFNRMHLIRFWLQLRYSRFTRYTVLWDYLKSRSEIPILGNPDIILYDKINLNPRNCELTNLVILEWEFTEKAAHLIFDRIEELAKNGESVFFLIVSDQMSLLKKYANAVRKCVPGSSSYTGKKSFSSTFLNFDYHVKRLWFVHWDPLKHPVQDSGIDQANCYRFDHEAFDSLGPPKERFDGKKERIPVRFNRFGGRQEHKFEVLMQGIVRNQPWRSDE